MAEHLPNSTLDTKKSLERDLIVGYEENTTPEKESWYVTSAGNQKRKYDCEFCQRFFYHRGAYTRHRRVHTGEKPFICPVCRKPFTLKHHVIYHMRTIHQEFDLEPERAPKETMSADGDFTTIPQRSLENLLMKDTNGGSHTSTLSTSALLQSATLTDMASSCTTNENSCNKEVPILSSINLSAQIVPESLRMTGTDYNSSLGILSVEESNDCKKSHEEAKVKTETGSGSVIYEENDTQRKAVPENILSPLLFSSATRTLPGISKTVTVNVHDSNDGTNNAEDDNVVFIAKEKRYISGKPVSAGTLSALRKGILESTLPSAHDAEDEDVVLIAKEKHNISRKPVSGGTMSVLRKGIFIPKEKRNISGKAVSAGTMSALRKGILENTLPSTGRARLKGSKGDGPKHHKKKVDTLRCRSCGDRFVSAIELFNHLPVHDKKMFQCKLCNEDCGTESGLLRHIRRMHKQDL